MSSNSIVREVEIGYCSMTTIDIGRLGDASYLASLSESQWLALDSALDDFEAPDFDDVAMDSGSWTHCSVAPPHGCVQGIHAVSGAPFPPFSVPEKPSNSAYIVDDVFNFAGVSGPMISVTPDGVLVQESGADDDMIAQCMDILESISDPLGPILCSGVTPEVVYGCVGAVQQLDVDECDAGCHHKVSNGPYQDPSFTEYDRNSKVKETLDGLPTKDSSRWGAAFDLINLVKEDIIRGSPFEPINGLLTAAARAKSKALNPPLVDPGGSDAVVYHRWAADSERLREGDFVLGSLGATSVSLAHSWLEVLWRGFSPYMVDNVRALRFIFPDGGPFNSLVNLLATFGHSSVHSSTGPFGPRDVVVLFKPHCGWFSQDIDPYVGAGRILVFGDGAPSLQMYLRDGLKLCKESYDLDVLRGPSVLSPICALDCVLGSGSLIPRRSLLVMALSSRHALRFKKICQDWQSSGVPWYVFKLLKRADDGDKFRRKYRDRCAGVADRLFAVDRIQDEPPDREAKIADAVMARFSGRG